MVCFKFLLWFSVCLKTFFFSKMLVNNGFLNSFQKQFYDVFFFNRSVFGNVQYSSSLFCVTEDFLKVAFVVICFRHSIYLYNNFLKQSSENNLTQLRKISQRNESMFYNSILRIIDIKLGFIFLSSQKQKNCS